MNILTELNVDGYERVVRCDNTKVGFSAWIAVHDTTLGPALGGCRVWNYESDEAALTDALRLSKGMTYKNALARLELGGGKSVVRANLDVVDRAALFQDFGKFVDHLEGLYITAEDVNSTLADMEIVKKQTEYVATVGASGNPSPFTAYGVYCGIRASVRHKLKLESLDGLTVAIQGVGETGARLAEMLAQDGCRILAADINVQNLKRLREKIHFHQITAEKIYDVDCDVFAPCALGGILNSNTIPRLRCAIVAGSANNQLLQEEDGEALRNRGILYAPDFAINAGGVINIDCEIGQSYDPVKARQKTAQIASSLQKIFESSEHHGLSTNRVAVMMAEDLIAEQRRSMEPLAHTA
jgi:leucine dehydrogenase